MIYRNLFGVKSLSEKEESVCKAFFFDYYTNIYMYVYWLIPDHNCAESITRKTLIQICHDASLHNEEKLLETAQQIAYKKWLDLKERKLNTHTGNSDKPFKTTCNNALQVENWVTDWKRSSLAVQEKMFADHSALFTPPDKTDPAQHWESFIKEFKASRRPSVNRVRMIAAAALIILMFGMAVFYFTIASRQPFISMQTVAEVIEPTLILSNGTIIKLDSVPNGARVAPGIPIMKLNPATLLYVPVEHKDQVQAQDIHILTVPPGRRYQITLADSSLVLLNESSQLHFPVNFSKAKRCVALEGEAYFKVKANRTSPFFVNVKNKLSIHVTGTAFNVHAYHHNKIIKTTLEEGHLAITEYSGKKSRSLQPGQQVCYENGDFFPCDTGNIHQVTAWKDEFNFNNISVKEVIEEIGRWYNVKVKFMGETPALSLKFNATLFRSKPLSATINTLSAYYNLYIVQVGDTLVVSPQQ